MKTKLDKTWMPPENVLKLAKAKGMPIENWLYHLLPEWRLYWIDSGLTKDSWGSTFWNWAKKQWVLVDKRRMYHENKPRFDNERIKGDTPRPPLHIVLPAEQENTAMSSEKRIEFADYLSRCIK